MKYVDLRSTTLVYHAEQSNMEIFVNDKAVELPDQLTIKEVLHELNISEKGIAVAINDVVIQRKDWNNQIAKPNDQLLIITATQGG